jgi:cytochrome b561
MPSDLSFDPSPKHEPMTAHGQLASDMPATRRQPYTRTAILMHWLVAPLVLANLALGWCMVAFARDSFSRVLFWHASIGSLIFILAVFRLSWRLTHTPPPLPASVKRWQVIASHATHALLYVLMLGVPLTGYVHRLAGGHPVSFFGLGALPVFIGKDEQLRLLADSLHKALVFVLAALVVGHIGAALKHRLVDRDGVAERMSILSGGRS